jgi:hypothetical protein
MSTFKITWASGLVDTEEVSDCDTVEAFVNRRFGSVDPEEYGTKVEMVGVEPESQAVDPEEEEEE